MIFEIIEELNLKNGSNYKIDVLKKHKDNELLQRVLKMTYDSVAFTYGISQSTIQPGTLEPDGTTLENALDFLENKLATRLITGNDARDQTNHYLNALSEDDAEVLWRIIGRDLKINLGKTQINKVFKGLITKPVYMRCDVYGEKTKKNISYPAMVQMKADGTYREFTVRSGISVESRSRSGESYEYPVLFEQMKLFPSGVYVGELTIKGITDRAESNGMINSDEPPHDDIIVELWDFITFDEYELAGKKDKKNPCKNVYINRFNTLHQTLSTFKTTNVQLIEFRVVETLGEALKMTSKWMNAGFEGSILKDLQGVFKDGTSKQQLKLKLEIDLEVRLVGFQEGTPGTKREKTFGAFIFENDEGTIKGRCSGFTDKQLADFNSRREELIGEVFTVQFNDITKGRDNDYYALSHPRFITFRDDKDETDTLEKAFKYRDMAMQIEEKSATVEEQIETKESDVQKSSDDW